MRRLTIAIAALAAAMLGASFIAPTTAADAHHGLTASTPAAGEQLQTPPTSIRLQFAFDVRADASIELIDAAGESWTSSGTVVDGADVSVSVDPAIGDGRHHVRWSVVSLDGAAEQGVIPFTIGDAPAPDPLDVVIDADAAAWIRATTFGVLAALLIVIAVGLATTYGLTSRSRPGSRTRRQLRSTDT